MAVAERVVIIGGDAAGMSAVSRIRKGRPDAEIVALERSPWTSYSACGIPYLVGGVVEGGVDRLVARSPDQHREQGTDVRTGHEATAIDLEAREVQVRPLDGEEYRLGFDQLLIATGGTPLRPDLPGIDLPFIHGVQNLDDAAHLLDHAQTLWQRCQRVVVVGSGYIGLEMAEAFKERGCTAIVLEQAAQPMGTLDPEMGALVAIAMVTHGIDLRCGVSVTGFEPETVLTDGGPIGADLVVLGIGVGPNAALAADAGLELGVKGAVHVDERQATSARGVWAAGDCCESRHLLTGQPVHIPLGTYANKQGRVAGINIGGGHAVSAGVLGTAITKLCSTEIARTGLGRAEAERAGLSAVAARIDTTTTSRYFPAAAAMTVKMVAERGTGRLLGAQIVGGDGAAKRIDTCAAAITAGMTVAEVVDLDLAYAPPFSSVWDPVATAARETLKLL
jgi:NADPH-dependent 2,4-dienoyl-CoA reductase/sulfur reductase-like enzyme